MADPRTAPGFWADPTAVTNYVHATVPAIARLGLRVTRLAPGEVDLLLPLAGNANHLGTMYAVAEFALAELPGGLLPWTVLTDEDLVPVVKSSATRWRRPAVSDVTVAAAMPPAEIEALGQRARTEGKADFTLDLLVRDTAGEVCMTATNVYQLRRLGPR